MQATLSKLKLTISPKDIFPSIVAGLVIGVLIIFVDVSFAAMIFSGDLNAYLSQAIGFILFGAFVISLIVTIFSSLKTMVACPQDSPAAILGVIAISIMGQMQANSLETIFFTLLTVMALSTVVTGISFWLIGHFDLGRFVRFIPFPVVGGFLAGTGWLLFMGGVSVMADAPFSLTLLQPDLLWRWVPGVFFAILLFVLLRRFSHFLLLPGLLIGGIVAFYLGYFLVAGSFNTPDLQTWLLGPFPKGGVWEFMTFTAFGEANWRVVFGTFMQLGTITIISVISMLLNISGVEVAIGEDVNLNRELKTAGISNLVAGFGGSSLGFQSISMSVLGRRLGVNNRFAGLVASALVAFVLFFGASALSIFPKMIAGGILSFLGLSFLLEWVYDGWKKLSKLDYFLVWLIIITIVTVGFLEGVGLGILIAALLFVLNYSQINVVRHAVTGADFQSYVMRPRLYQQLLRQKGDSLYILELQGYIFFGTADRLVEQIRARIETPDFAEIKYLVLDFRLVTGVDSSATFSFTKLMQLIQNRKIVLAFTNLAPAIRSLWEKEIFINANPAYLKLFPDLDQGVSWCEDQMIEVFTSVGLVAKPKTLFQLLEAALPKPKTETDLMDLLLPKKKSASPNRQQTRLLKYFEQIETQVGQTIVAEGAEIQGLYFVEKGQVIAQKQTAILRIMQAGTAFGETDFYAAEQKAAADYVVSQPGILFYLSSDQLQAMEADDLILSNAFHRLIAENLSKKLIQTNDTILALQR